MTKTARETGLRQQLYKSLSEEGNPTLETLLAVLKAMGLGITGKRRAARESDSKFRNLHPEEPQSGVSKDGRGA